MPSRCGQEEFYILSLSLAYLDFFFFCEIIYCSYMQRNCLIVNSDLLRYDVPLAQAMQKKKNYSGLEVEGTNFFRISGEHYQSV